MKTEYDHSNTKARQQRVIDLIKMGITPRTLEIAAKNCGVNTLAHLYSIDRQVLRNLIKRWGIEK